MNLELADGAGVLVVSRLKPPIAHHCALCGDGTGHSSTHPSGLVCPICQRTFCYEPCFYAHWAARDELDPKLEVEAYGNDHAHDDPLLAGWANEACP